MADTETGNKLRREIEYFVNKAEEQGLNKHDFVCCLNLAVLGVADMATLNGALAASTAGTYKTAAELESAWGLIATTMIKIAAITGDIHSEICPGHHEICPGHHEEGMPIPNAPSSTAKN